MPRKRRVQVKVYLSEDKPEVDSIHDLYKMVNWFEREAWDMFGIVFKGHPNLIRILCHNDFVGHPLRKDYPAEQYQRLKNAAPPSAF
jgi:NADH:ubiquinone oxidoreductase subunit C